MKIRLLPVLLAAWLPLGAAAADDLPASCQSYFQELNRAVQEGRIDGSTANDITQQVKNGLTGLSVSDQEHACAKLLDRLQAMKNGR